MAAPDSYFYEAEFTAGVWTDIAPYVVPEAGISTTFGRTSPFSAPSPGSLTLTLDNSDGRFTPKRQLLLDGTANPYYPNVVVRKRIRCGYIVAATRYTRFTGYVKGWPLTMADGDTARVAISATTRDAFLAKDALLSPIRHELTLSAPTYLWPMTDASGSSSIAETSSNGGPALTRAVLGAGGAWALGDNGAGSGDGTGLKLTPASTSNASWFETTIAYQNTHPTGLEVEFMVNVAAAPAATSTLVSLETLADFTAGSNDVQRFQVNTSGQLVYTAPGYSGGGFTSGASITDAGWHHVALVMSGSILSRAVALYLDGVLVGSATGTWRVASGPFTIRVGQAALGSGDTSSPASMNIGWLGLYPVAGNLTATTAASHALARNGFAGETPDVRIKRILGYGGLTAGDWNIDASTVVLSSYDQGGKDIIAACQQAAVDEGGDAVFYFGPDGLAQFRSRTYRKPAAPVLTLAAEADLDGGAYSGAYDDTLVVNSSQATRATGSGSASVQVASDTVSQAANGITAESFTSYSNTDADVLNNAYGRIASRSSAAFRIEKVPLDLMTATTAGLYAASASAGIGQRIRNTLLPAGAAPAPGADVLIEGWSERWGSASHDITFDTSTADAPARAVWDDTTYGRWFANDITLSASITISATTIVLVAPTAPFTTTGGAYPFDIRVGEERITLNSAPGGATSPQTFTGVTRGANRTVAAPQSAGAAVSLAPGSTWTL